MVPKISDIVMFISIVNEIWETVKIMYSKVCDAAQIYEIKIEVMTIKQVTRLITDYSNLL